MNRPPIRAWRLLAALGQVTVMWFAAVLVMPWVSRPRRDRMIARFARGMLRAFNVRVSVRGAAPSARGPMVLVANHVSWLDPHLLNLVAGARFVAKSEVARYPVFGTIIRQFGAIFIRRGHFRDAMRVRHEAAAALAGGEHVAFFPEGSTTDGTRIDYFYPALFQAAVDRGAAVQPIAIRYRHNDGSLNLDAAFIGDMTLAESIALLLKWPVIHAEVTLCAPIAAQNASRRELAHHTRTIIAEQLGLARLAPRPRHLPWAEPSGNCPPDTESPASNAPAPWPAG